MKLLIYFFLFIHFEPVFAKDAQLSQFYNKYWKVTNKTIEYIQQGKIIVDSDVETQKITQSFNMHIAAMHKKSCTKVLRKLALYENYSGWVSFIKKSTYDSKNNLLTIRADHALLPYPMIVHVIVERPKKPGKYEFVFPTGMFTGLKGYFIVKKHKGSCAFYAQSAWEGKKTQLPAFVIELFSETLTKLAGEILFRKLN